MRERASPAPASGDGSPSGRARVAELVRRWWRRPVRGWPVVASWALTALVVAAALLRLSGVEHGALLIQAVSFTPYAVPLAVLAVGLAGLTRQWWSAGAALVAVAALLGFVVPRALGAPAAADGPRLTVMSANLLVGEADAQSIVDTVRLATVDVLAVQELTPDAEAALDGAGLAGLLPYRESHPDLGASGSALYSRYPLSDGGSRVASPDGHGQAYAVVHAPGVAPVHIESVHPVPPLDGESTGRWAAGLRNQPPAGSPGPTPILAGDFNATLDHAELRRLLDTGYADAASEVGAGLSPTWPYHGLRARLTPRITIDHVLVPPSVGVHSFTVVAIPRTDHRAIIATLVLPTP